MPSVDLPRHLRLVGEGRRRVAVYPGAFSPVHQGHLEIVMAVLDSGLVDDVIVIPATSAYPKPGLGPAAERLRALERLIVDLPHVHVSDIDLSRERHPTVLETLFEMGELMPLAQLLLVIGGDRLEWLAEHGGDELRRTLAVMPVVVVERGSTTRERIGRLTADLGGCIVTLGRVVQVSSTELRQQSRRSEGQ